MTGTALAARDICGDAPAIIAQDRREMARARFPARAAGSDWPATRLERGEILTRIAQPPVTGDRRRLRGADLLLDWLQDQPGDSWQQRWLASGADAAGKSWRDIAALSMRGHGTFNAKRHALLAAALPALIAADIVRPSLGWFLSRAASSSSLSAIMTQIRDPDGFTRLRALCEHGTGVSEITAGLIMHRAAVITAVKGGVLADIRIGDILELLDAEKAVSGRRTTGSSAFYGLLRQLGIFGTQTPATLRELGSAGQRTPAELIDRYQITCRPIRDLLVDYLRERQPALDYNSLESLSIMLGKLFWADIEHHHPGIASLHLPPGVADAWKSRLQTVTRTIRNPDGGKSVTQVPRINYRECLTPVRAFYLDLACWAADDPARWGPWAVPCPVGSEEISRAKQKRQRKSRMDTRTRDRLPVLPVLIRTARQRRDDSAARLQAARITPAGESFTAAGQTLTRSVTTRATGRIWADDPSIGRRDLTREDERAFWTWAAVETLRATGVRIEELLELTHHSLVQYRLPSTGEIVPLLQVAPSKTDAERLLLVSPELADVLSAIISRVRGADGKVPLAAGYDHHERRWREPAPFLFQRHVHGDIRVFAPDAIRGLLNAALAGTGLTDQQTGGRLQYTPHDFRRIFITDAILGGLPPHIAQIVAGHRDINVTMGYKAVYVSRAFAAGCHRSAPPPAPRRGPAA